ncbi:MAG: ATP phosphoribosyltransferase [Anaerolineales bacterium]
MQPSPEIRLALPSKGRLAEDALELLAHAGLRVHKPNPRQLIATIPALPHVSVLFQRASDIVVSVRDGSVDFGITGGDVVAEKRGFNGDVLTLLDDLGFGHCALHVIVPEAWDHVATMRDLTETARGRRLRIATKFPNLTTRFLEAHHIPDAILIPAEGTLEVAPTIGYADLIVDLVSSGTTIRDNRLKTLADGLIFDSRAWLIANHTALQTRPEALQTARTLIETITAHQRANENVLVIANMRGTTPEAVAQKIFTQTVIGGLQGPTIAPVFTRAPEKWFSVSIVVRKTQLTQAITELRTIGGSGVIVTPVTYIFEEEPEAYRRMLMALEK